MQSHSKLNSAIKYKITAAFALVVLLQSCVSIETTSYSDPDYIGKSYNKICVYSVEGDLNLRSKIEGIFVDKFTGAELNVVQGSTIFPPTREWEDEDFQKTLLANGFDGFLKIEMIDEDINVTTTPVYDTDTYTSTKENEDGETETVIETRTTVSENTNVHVQKKFQADMIDVRTNKIAWRGFSATDANMSMIGMHRETIIEKFAEGVIEELKVKAHITPK
jgi:hypothetical protein